jgi:hypothetical protein
VLVVAYFLTQHVDEPAAEKEVHVVIALSNAGIAGLAIILVILIVAFIAVLGRARRP